MAEAKTPAVNVERFRREIHDGIEFRDPHLMQGRRVLEYIESGRIDIGTTFGVGEMAEHEIVPDNLMQGVYRSMIPSLYLDDPRALVRPSADRYHFAAAQIEAKLNYELRELYFSEQAEYWISNSLIYGYGPMQIGFGHPWGGFPGQTRDGTSGAPLIQRVMDTQALAEVEPGQPGTAAARNGNGRAARAPDEASVKKPLYHAEQRIRVGNVWRMSVLPEDFLADPKADDLRNAEWVAKQFFLTGDQVDLLTRGPKPFLKGDRRHLRPWQFTQQHGRHAMELEGMRGIQYLAKKAKHAEVRMFKFWQRWDRVHMRHYIIAENDAENQTWDDREWPAPRESFPFVMLIFNARQGRFYGASELGSMESGQQQTNFLNTKIVQHAKMQKDLVAYDETSGITADNIEKFTAAEPASFVGVPGDVSKMIQHFKLGQDLQVWMAVKEMLKTNERNAMGIAQEDLGGVSNADTATQVAVIQQKSGTRGIWRLSKVHRALRDVYRQSVIWDRYTWAAQSGTGEADREIAKLLDDRVIFRGMRGLNRDGSLTQLAGLTGDEIEAEYDVEIDSIAASPWSKDKMRAELLQFANMFIPTGIIDIRAFADGWLSLSGLKIPGLITEPPTVLDAHEEHERIALGGQVQVQPEEDKRKHAERHMAFLQEIGNIMKGGQSQSVIAQLIAKDPMKVQVLAQHLEETQKAIAGPAGARSMEDKAVAPNKARAGIEQGGAQVAAASGGRPAGIAGTSLEQMLTRRG